MNDILKIPKSTQIKFVGRIYILRKKEKKKIALILHVLAYQEKDSNNIQAVCLELGVFVDGKNEDSIYKQFEDVINDVIEKYSAKDIINLIKSTSLEKYWALYREYTHKNSEKDIIKIFNNIEKENTNQKLIEQQRYQIKNLQDQIKTLELPISSSIPHSKHENSPTFTDYIIDDGSLHIRQVVIK